MYDDRNLSFYNNRRKCHSLVSICVSFAFSMFCSVAYGQNTSQRLNYRTSWIGNSFGGKSDQWVQNWVEAMFVSADGTVYTNAYWDEGGREVGIYRDGKVVGLAAHTHGWGATGGAAITANDRYLYFAQSVNNEGGNLKDPARWPAKGRLWFGISRRLVKDPATGVSFPGAKGGTADSLPPVYLVINDVPEADKAPVNGLAASSKELFVSDPANSKVRVYDAETMEPVRSWQAKNPCQMALAPDGTLWCVTDAAILGRFEVAHYGTDGRSLPGAILFKSNVHPHGLAIDGNGRILVADDGVDQNVKIYRPGNAVPVASVGVKGGVLAGPVHGAVGPARFHDLSGVGVDGQGRIYVASGYGVSGDGVGTELECVTAVGEPQWRMSGLFFVDQADFDPIRDEAVYAKHEELHLNYGASTPGSEWSYHAFTLDRFLFPDDPRLHVSPTTVWVRYIGGRPFLYMTDMYSSFLAIYRFDAAHGEIAIPCGYFAKNRQKDAHGSDWPSGQPSKGEWIWNDLNLDGKFNFDEYSTALHNPDAPALWGWWVDAAGDVWQATERDGIRHFKMFGMTSAGGPSYDYAHMQVEKTPGLFNNLQRAQYDLATDTMYLSGYTDAAPNDNRYWKVVGRVIACVDRWSAGNRKPVWTRTVSKPDTQHVGQQAIPASFTVAGDYLLTVEVFDARVEVYNRRTGENVGYLSPGPEVGSLSGWVDVPYGISARLRKDGEYEILVEEDARAKNILYRWRPQAAVSSLSLKAP